MKHLGKIWDFLFGVALIAGAPLAGLFVLMIGFFIFYRDPDIRLILAAASVLFGTAFAAACLWRRKHRHLPNWVLIVEMLVAVLGLFLFLLACGAIVRIGGG